MFICPFSGRKRTWVCGLLQYQLCLLSCDIFVRFIGSLNLSAKLS
ncbi:Aa_trans domain-containing protein [Psidium guajava]|nr:Aa_trans domain-containing protein [Psidium guajava]